MPEIVRRGLLIGAGIAGGAVLARAAAPPDTPRPTPSRSV